MFLSRLRSFIVLVAVLFFLNSNIAAQVQTPRYNVSMTANTNGFYEYLPANYNDPGNTTKYPLILFLHGQGELGNGSVSQLPTVLRNGPPKLINQGTFPTSFTINGQVHKFIVISPQFIAWPSTANINAIFSYLKTNYRIDTNRIYLTGLSMGGGAVWEYAGSNIANATKLAAILPICGASWPDPGRAYIMAASNLPVWATHNNGDNVAPVFYTNDYISHYQAAPIQSIIAPKKTIFIANGHDAWSTTYNPTWRENGIYNVYEWMLTHQRGVITVLPVTLSSYTVTANTTVGVSIAWATTQEQNNSHFTIEKSTDGISFSIIGQVQSSNSSTGSSYNYVDNSPGQGVIFYRLSQTDIDGRKTYYDIKKITFGNQGVSIINFFPNPVINTANLELNFAYTGKITISVYQTNGKRVKQFQINKTTDYIRQQLNLEGVSSGYYNLEIRGENLLKSVQFVKQ